ncbi:MAG: septum formation inhibitor Maf, partial [Bdellovibrio sp. CG10_big_fil_rev_8_21_14_0_10_47_8]
PKTLAVTLAEVKAHSLSTAQNCVIGGDQLVSLEGEILCKPKSFEGACLQLAKMQGKTHQLITALCVIHGGQKIPLLDITEIEMRELSPQQIRAYVTMDQPLDCAGSYKIEKSGLVLVKSLNTKDFSAIQGLPLIQLVQTLTSLGYPIPGSGNKE